MNYKLTDITDDLNGIIFRQLIATSDFEVERGRIIKSGTIGGWVEDINSLNGNSWIYEGSYLSAGNVLHDTVFGDDIVLASGQNTFIKSSIWKLDTTLNVDTTGNTFENVKTSVDGSISLYGNDNYFKNVFVYGTLYIQGNGNYFAGKPFDFSDDSKGFNNIKIDGFVLIHTDNVVVDVDGAEFNSTNFFNEPTIIKGENLEFGFCFFDGFVINKRDDFFFITGFANHSIITFGRNKNGEAICNGITNGVMTLKEVRNEIYKTKEGSEYKLLNGLLDLAELKFN